VFEKAAVNVKFSPTITFAGTLKLTDAIGANNGAFAVSGFGAGAGEATAETMKLLPNKDIVVTKTSRASLMKCMNEVIDFITIS
jgi:hypothetical protein